MVKILAIAGSPSHPSRTYSVLEYAKRTLEKHHSVDLLSVRDISAEALVLAQFDHADVKRAIAAVEQADVLIISTPVYKAAYTGVLKTFLDLLPQNALREKTILPIATGGTIAHLLAIDYALKPVLNNLGARSILGGVYIVDTQIQRQENGEIRLDEESEQRLQAALDQLLSALPTVSATLSSR